MFLTKVSLLDRRESLIFNIDSNFYNRLITAIFCVYFIVGGFQSYYKNLTDKFCSILIIVLGFFPLCFYMISVHI